MLALVKTAHIEKCPHCGKPCGVLEMRGLGDVRWLKYLPHGCRAKPVLASLVDEHEEGGIGAS